MQSRIEVLKPKKLIGKRLTMSLANNRTRELWQSFMPEKMKIKNAVSPDLYSMQIYDSQYFNNFNPETEFIKWAAIEVTNPDTLTEGMEFFDLEGGLYSVFLYKGAASNGPEIFRYIFGIWLPDSGFILDNRPHFEILGEKYKNESPDSEEEIWIPVRAK